MLQINKKDKYKVRRVKRAALKQSRFLLDLPEPLAIEKSQKTFNHAFGNIHHFLNYIMQRTEQSYKLYHKLHDLSLDSKRDKYEELVVDVVSCVHKGAEARAQILKTRTGAVWKDSLIFEAKCITSELSKKSGTLKSFLQAILRVYTLETFICYWMNDLLRSENWEELNVLMPYLVCLAFVFKRQEFLIKRGLFRAIGGFIGLADSNNLVLYRGAALLEKHLMQYDLNNIKHFSWNGFTSTSLSEGQARSFIMRSLEMAQRQRESKTGVMFIIHADFISSEDCEGIIDVSALSKFPDEKEVILSPGSVFELLSVNHNKDGVWNIKLKLTRNFVNTDRSVSLLGNLQESIVSGDTAIFANLSRERLIKGSILLTGNKRVTKLEIISCVIDSYIIEILGKMWRTTNIKPKDIVLRQNKIHLTSLSLLYYYFSIEDLYLVCQENTIVCSIDEMRRTCWVIVIASDYPNGEPPLPVDVAVELSLLEPRMWELSGSLGHSIKNLLLESSSKVIYNIFNAVNEGKPNERNDRLIEDIERRSHEFKDLLYWKVQSMIDPEQIASNIHNWQKLILLDNSTRKEAASLVDAINLALSKYYERLLTSLIYRLDKECLINVYFDAVRTESEQLIRLWHEGFKKIEVDCNTKVNNAAFEVDVLLTLQFPFSTYEATIIEKIQASVDQTQQHVDPAATEEMNMKRLKENSLFETNFRSLIVSDDTLCNKYIHDQVCLFVVRNMLKVDVEMAIQMLDYMTMTSPQENLQYFLSNAEEYKVILRGIEAVLSLKEGESIFKQALKGRYNPNDCSSTDEWVGSKVEQQQRQEKEQLDHNMDLKEQQHLAKSKLPSLRRFFADVVSEITSYRYLSQFTTIRDVTSAFTLIEDKLIKTDFYPHNMEMLRQLVYLLNFIEDCHIHPDKLFKSFVTRFSVAQAKNIFLNIVTVKERVDFVVSECSSDGVDRVTRQRIVSKLKAEIYKNFISTWNEESLIRAMSLLAYNPKSSRASSKCLILLEAYTELSIAIQEHKGRVELCKDYPYLKMLEEQILSKVSNEARLMLANNVFVIIKAELHDDKSEFLDLNAEVFHENLKQYEKIFETRKSAEQKETSHVSFISLAVWLRLYMHFYAEALTIEGDTFLLRGMSDFLLQKRPPETNTETESQGTICIQETILCFASFPSYRDKVVSLIDTPTTTIKEMQVFFNEVEASGTEVQILSSTFDQERCKYFENLLVYISEEEFRKRICKALKLCTRMFSLDSTADVILEAGCHLSKESFVKDFYEVNQKIDQFLDFKRNEVVTGIKFVSGTIKLLHYVMCTIKDRSKIDYHNLLDRYTDDRFDFTNLSRLLESLKGLVAGKTINEFLSHTYKLINEPQHLTYDDEQHLTVKWLKTYLEVGIVSNTKDHNILKAAIHHEQVGSAYLMLGYYNMAKDSLEKSLNICKSAYISYDSTTKIQKYLAFISLNETERENYIKLKFEDLYMELMYGGNLESTAEIIASYTKLLHDRQGFQHYKEAMFCLGELIAIQEEFNLLKQSHIKISEAFHCLLKIKELEDNDISYQEIVRLVRGLRLNHKEPDHSWNELLEQLLYRDPQNLRPDFGTVNILDELFPIHYDHAISLYSMKEFGTSQIILEELIKLKPSDTKLRNTFAYCLKGQGKLLDGINVLKVALTINELDDSLYDSLAELQVELGDLDAALENQSKAIQMNPTLSTYYANRGEILFKMQREEEALKDIDHAHKLLDGKK